MDLDQQIRIGIELGSMNGKLRDAIRAVLDLHRGSVRDRERICPECSDDPFDQPWPCPTVRAIAGQLGIAGAS